MTPHDIVPRRAARSGLRWLAIAALAGFAAAAAATSPAIEYHHAGFDHYFVTASPAEIAALDAGKFAGWTRTGESFGVFDLGSPDTASVCRFFSGQTFAPKSSHFYTASAIECAKVMTSADWTFEGTVFAIVPADATGSCPPELMPLYRLYNDGQGGAPNHRYTTRAGTRTGMIAQGWIPEGDGAGVVGCVPALPPARIVAAGDIAQCFDGPAADSAAAQTARLVTDDDLLVLTLGDNAYEDGTPAQFANCFDPTWGAFKSRIRPSPGNHDYRTTDAAGYFDYFGPQAGPNRRGYYSFDFAGWHFVSLDSLIDVSASSEQYRWLVADLAQSAATACTIAYWHFPAFNSGASYGSIATMRPFFQALYDGGVDLVLSGHEHVYERFAPQKADGTADPVRGVREFLVGTGGHELSAFGGPLPNSEFRASTSWGVLRLTLGVGEYGWEFVPVGGGAPLDSGHGTCHR